MKTCCPAECGSLSSHVQSLALQLQDVNSNGQLDILVGNDFDTRDDVFLAQADGRWQAAHSLPVEPFATTTFSTMSFDRADINPDGVVLVISGRNLPPNSRLTITRRAVVPESASSTLSGSSEPATTAIH